MDEHQKCIALNNKQKNLHLIGYLSHKLMLEIELSSGKRGLVKNFITKTATRKINAFEAMNSIYKRLGPNDGLSLVVCT